MSRPAEDTSAPIGKHHSHEPVAVSLIVIPGEVGQREATLLISSELAVLGRARWIAREAKLLEHGDL
jgi:hypothetical protein